MQFFNHAELEQKVSVVLGSTRSILGSAAAALANEARQHNSRSSYDVFLSHSTLDAKVVYGLSCVMKDSGFSVYVYWLDDASEQSEVTPETAQRLRERMKCCRVLLFATSENAINSKWMPWELGYFDGTRGKVAICPISQKSTFEGREYLGLYPIMERDFWIWRNGQPYKRLRTWIDE
ncbi:MAG: hypothetical protein A2583_02775 [Bdellovibrionales bacterium RIFOXYD1_FULL_53_11]|nr:MAG: hypothetical protein A2583_02775 [Bdellovibrionales bacterium RIFOXYD1_FULL_53_11]